MQLLSPASKASPAEDVCARHLLDTVPLVMRVIRQHMRRHRSGLTVPQFRTLCFVSSTEASSLSAAADFIGLSLPAMSRLVDGLVEQRLVKRRACDEDRRHVRLSITSTGEATLSEAREQAKAQIAVALAKLSRKRQEAVMGAMTLMRDVFTPELSSDGEQQQD